MYGLIKRINIAIKYLPTTLCCRNEGGAQKEKYFANQQFKVKEMFKNMKKIQIIFAFH